MSHRSICKFAAGLILVFLLVPALQAQEPSVEPEGEVFRVALSGKYPPFSFYDSQGNLQGFDVDVSREVAKRLGRPVEIIATDWTGIIPGLVSGRYDAIIGSMAITPEREKAVLFSRPYYVSGAQLFVRAEDTSRFQSIGDFGQEDVIGAGTGSTYEQYLTRNHPNLEIQLYVGESDLFQDLKTGRLDGFVTDRFVGMYNIDKAGFAFEPVGPLLYKERCAIPVTKDNEELVQKINAALNAMEEDGFFARLQKKWFGKSMQETAAARDAEAKASGQEAQDISELASGEMTAGTIIGIMLKGFSLTLVVAAFSIIVGFILSIPIGVGINNGPAPLRFVLIAYTDIIRGTPVLVQLFFFYYGLGQFDFAKMTPLQAGILTMTINASAYMGEVVRSGLMSVPAGQVTGALALGLTKIQAFRHVVWPQAFRIMVPPLMNSVVALLKDTALVSVIAVPEVITQTQKIVAVTYQPMPLYAGVALMFFLVAFPLMKAAQYLENQMRKKGYAAEK